MGDLFTARAASFGDDAEQYDRSRPGYPDELVFDLDKAGASDALDVGCGTGKVAKSLMNHGWRVLGVEPDDRMAAVARRAGIDVVTSSFEDFATGERRFDLVTAGQTWHWVDERVGPERAAEALRPGGQIALFWNIDRLAATMRTALDEVYRRNAVAMGPSRATGTLALDPSIHTAALDRSGAFSAAEVRHYPWQREFTTAEWLDLLPTHSDHRILPHDVLQPLLREIGATIDGLGGVVTVSYDTVTILASKRP